MIMGGDSCSIGCVLESQHRIRDGHFSHLIVVKLLCLLEKTKINHKEAGEGRRPIFKSILIW